MSSLTVSQQNGVKAIKRVRASFDAQISHLFAGMIENVEQVLFEGLVDVADHEQSDREVQMAGQFNLMRALRLHAPALEGRFGDILKEQWVDLLKNKQRREVDDLPDHIETDLVRMARKYNGQFQFLLQALIDGFTGILERPVEALPLQPVNMYHIFWTATEVLEVSAAERELLIPLFDRYVVDRIGRLLAGARESLGAA